MNRPKEKHVFYDSSGIQISDGDLLRIFHFTHYRRREKVYMYKVARLIDGNWYGVDLNGIITGNGNTTHKYLLYLSCVIDFIVDNSKVLMKSDDSLDIDDFKRDAEKRARLKNKK